MAFRLTQDVLLRELGPGTVDKGRRMQAAGHVRSIDVSAEGTRISGNVRSSTNSYFDRRPYSQTISLVPAGDGVRIKGYCTCPVKFNCKHVAAALLEHAIRDDRVPTNDGADEPRVVGESSEVLSPCAAAAIGKNAHGPASAPPQPRAALSRPVSDWLDRLITAAAPRTRARKFSSMCSITRTRRPRPHRFGRASGP
jgi:hypothetical protein